MLRVFGPAVLVLALAVAAVGAKRKRSKQGRGRTCVAKTTPSAKGTTLQIPADSGNLAFQKDSLTAPAGKVTLVMENPSSDVHNIAVEGEGVDVKGELAGPGETSRVTVDLEPGEYTFYCSVPLHRDGGMEGTLTVTC